MDFMPLWFILFIAITEYIKMSELIPEFFLLFLPGIQLTQSI